MGTASDSDSDDDRGQKRSGRGMVSNRADPSARLGLISPSDSGSDYPGFGAQPQVRLADTPSSGV